MYTHFFHPFISGFQYLTVVQCAQFGKFEVEYNFDEALFKLRPKTNTKAQQQHC